MRIASIACCAVLAAPLPAAAHAILLGSQPEAGTSVAAGMVTVVLRFNSRIDRVRSRLELRGAKAGSILRLDPSGPDTLTARAPVTSGSWVVRWQVLAVDGHITRGDVPFTVRAP